MTEFRLKRRDVAVGTVIASIMAVTFAWIGGRALIVTFDVGLVVVVTILVWLAIRGRILPHEGAFWPIYFGLLAWQFIHFTEEFITGFYSAFPTLYGGVPFSPGMFVGINMVSYAVFSVAFIVLYRLRLGFLLTPALFFIVYGAIGNAIAHTFWVLWLGEYFPGFVTAQFYWVLGPFALSRVLGSWRATAIATGLFACILVPALALGMV